jgi:hypothetical protein
MRASFKAWGHSRRNNTHQWLWVPGCAFACPGRRGWIQFSNSLRGKRSPPRGAKCARVMHEHCPSELRGAGNAECTKRTRSLACKMSKAHEHSHYRSAGIPVTPCANGFKGFLRALPGDRAFLSPSSARWISILANLTPASRRQNHTTSSSASASFVRARDCA